MKDKMDLMIDFLKVLNDRTRLDIIELLRNGKKKPLEIQNALNKSQSTISQQLKILIQADLVTYEQKGVEKEYLIKESKIFGLLTNITDFVSSINKNKSNVITSSNINDIIGVQ